ncbi:glycoside hydrolase family 28 protein [Micromonospora sp. SL1-18]|uniref:glycoside hydrolase family 28 protein n=1 Tax=Micromonospora sp. SL1-18 TaxID=3399128 RepID=UPI003A4DE9C4
MATEHSRRDLFRWAGAAASAAAFASLVPGRASADPLPPGNPWARAEYISAKVRRPHFPNRWFDIQEYGAVGDGTTDCTEAIRQAIAACHAAGGGHVLVPAGRFLTGPIHLLSNVDLHVTADAVVLFSQRPADYLPAVLTRFEGVELYNYSPLIYAFEQENIGVTGSGVLDGQADNAHWWPWKGKAEYGWKKGDPKQDAARARLFAMAEQGVPVEERVFGEGDYLRSSFIEPYRCRNVVIEGVTILRSPMWEIHPTLSENVLVQNVTVNSHGPNNDGCDPEASRMVVIRGCTFDTGDDCIAIKAGRNTDGRRVNVPSEDILIEDCLMRDGHGGVTIGSEMSGGVRNVFARNCEMSSPNLDIALRFKTNSVRGGFITDIYARDIRIGEVAGAVIDINFYYEEGPGYGFNPVVRNIDVQNLTVRQAGRSLNLRGYADDHITGVKLTNVDFGTTGKPGVVEYVDNFVLRNVLENGEPLVLASAAG